MLNTTYDVVCPQTTSNLFWTYLDFSWVRRYHGGAALTLLTIDMGLTWKQMVLAAFTWSMAASAWHCNTV